MASDFLKKKAQEQQQQLLLAQGYERIGKGTGTASDFLRRKAAEQAAADIQKEQERQQRNAGWFKGSTAFDDGWQFGDLTKTVAGTLQDVENDLRAGALGILEGTIDAGAYLVGGAGKLLGADAFADKVSGFIQKDLIDEEKIANMNLMTKLIGGGDAVEDYSIFGDKMDSVVQSGGQMLGQIGLQGVGIPWWVTSGVTSFGGQVEQALNEGASYGKAGASALISAGAEIFSEKLFGGSGLGEKGLINTEALTRGISNKVLKTLADFGVDIVSEGAEEVVSEIFSNLGTALYKEENVAEILASEEALQAYIDSFIGGAIMGGVANTSKAFSSTLGKAYKAAKEADQGKRFDWSASTDYRNGLTASEQKVFDSVYENTVKEAQEKNGELTKKDKAALYDRVMEDVKKGYISPETIEKTMGGEAYEQYQKLVNESEEFNDLYETPYEKLSQKQRDRLAELKAKNKANSYDDAISNAYENLKNQVTDGGNSFKESYAERGRRGQSFQADVSKYDEKYRSTVQKAIDSGILNNTNRSHEFVDLVAKISADTGTQFDFANNKKLAETLQDGDWADVTEFNPDLSRADIEQAIKTGKITVYSSYPIENGVFVSPSAMEAGSYSGNGMLYEKTVDIGDVAWIDPTQGQYAQVSGEVDPQFSLSPEGEQGSQYGDYNVYGEDVTRLAWDDIAPPTEGEMQATDDIAPPVERLQNAETLLGDDIAPPVENKTAVGDDIAPTMEEIARMDAQNNDLGDDFPIDPKVNNAVNEDIAPPTNTIDDLRAEELRLRAQFDEIFEGADTNDPLWQQDYLRLKEQYEAVSKAIKNWEQKASDVELSKNTVTNISRSVRKLLGLSNKQMAEARSLIEKYSDKRIPSREQLYSEVSELFGEHSERIVNEELKQVQKDLRTYGISVSEDIKSQIADYNDLRKRNFGKIRFSKDGLGVDAAYQELQEIAPGFFPDGIINPADQLMRIVEVANMQSEIVNKFDIDTDTLWQATDEIINGVNEYKHKKLERLAAKQDIAPVDLNAVLKNSQNRQPSAGVPLEDLAPPIDTATGQQTFTQEAAAQADAEANRLITHAERQHNLVEEARTAFANEGYDMDEVFKNAKDLSTWSTVDNTPQRVMEKALGWHEGKILSDLTVDRVAQHESEGIRWVNSVVDRLKTISKDHNIKPGSKESAAAQMYAEGFYVNKQNEIIAYGDRELAMDFPNAQVRKNIKALAADTRVRQIYDETLDLINESRVRNGYAPIPRLDNYFLHFRAMLDTFSQLGLPFNPNDIRAKDLPTDLNGVTADLKPGQPYFASAQHRNGKRTSFDLLGGVEMYINSAKNQIYHIDDIQMLRAVRNYIADTYGQAKGLESLSTMSEEEAQARIKEVCNSHMSTFAKFLNEEANVLAGKTSLVDRGLEGILGRRGIQTLETINRQVGANMVGFNVSSSLTNLLSVVQATAKTNKYAALKAFTQTISNRLTGTKDAFIENNPTVLRRRGADRFYRTPWQKVSDIGYALAGAVDDVATEMIVRGKYNELTGKGMDSQTAIAETDKWVSRLMGDRSLGQQPQIYNSKMLGIFTKFQLEVRNQLDSMFYDTIQESKASTENIQNEMERNAKTAAKATSTLAQLAVLQHLFGAAFEAVAGYNPAFDIISIMMTAFGWDDDEESEDTTLDNLEQAFLELLDDLPYTSMLTGGRVPIASALPIEELVTGKDSYGNEKSRWETAAEALPYYLLPGGYGQAKKTIQGLSMFDDDLPVTGSYTDSGNLRFPVEDTFGNRVQAALFGQYASENARDYFDNDRSTLKENQIAEFADLGVSIDQYRSIRSGLSKIESDKDAEGNTISGSKKKKVVQYIDGLDLTAAQKVTLYNGQYESEKDQVLEKLTTDFDEEDYWTWLKGLSSIESDKDANGKTVANSRKKKVVALLNSLDYLEYGQKIVLFRSEFTSDDTYCEDIVEYINGLNMKYADRVEILKALNFRISDDGSTVYWD